jgi:hypothetical protein
MRKRKKVLTRRWYRRVVKYWKKEYEWFDKIDFQPLLFGITSIYFCSLIIKILLGNEIPNPNRVILNALSWISLLIFLSYRKKIKRFWILILSFWFLFGYFPYKHYEEFKADPLNYIYDENFLSNSVREKLKNIDTIKGQSKIAESFSKIPDSIFESYIPLNSPIKISEKDSLFGEIRFVQNMPGPTLGKVMFYIDLKNSQGKKMSEIPFYYDDTSRKQSIQRYLNDHNPAFLKSIDPKDNIKFFHFWGEAISGFTLGYIKPASLFSIYLRLFQFIVGFIFLFQLNRIFAPAIQRDIY